MKFASSNLLWAPWFGLLLSAESNTGTLSLTANQIPATSSSGSVAPPGFAAFACEERSFPLFANAFSNNLIQEVAKRTGVRAVMRVGGSSLDAAKYSRAQKEPLIVPSGQDCINVPRGISIGPAFFDHFASLDVSYNIDIPLLSNNLTEAIQFAVDAYHRVGADNVGQLEVGNEPSSPSYNGLTKRQYVDRWANFTSHISSAIGLSNDDPIYMALSLAVDNPWHVPSVFREGPNNGGLIKYINRIKSADIHYYQVFETPLLNATLQRDLMNHTAIKTRIDHKRLGLDYCKSIGIPYSWGETGSSLNGYKDGIYNQTYNNYALEAVVGSALWSLDFMLYSISLGFHRNNYQLGFDFGYALWLPQHSNCTNRPAEVAVPYYAHIVTAEIIGNHGPVRIKNVDLQSSLLSAYSVYNDNTNQLKKIVLLNFRFWNTTIGSARPSVEVTIHVPKATRKVIIRRLISSGGATTMNPANVTWNGYSWLKANNGIGKPNPHIANDTRTIIPSNEAVRFSLPASSAAVLELV